jgi:hypothetical protein
VLYACALAGTPRSTDGVPQLPYPVGYMARHDYSHGPTCDHCGMAWWWQQLTGDPCLLWLQRVWRRLGRGHRRGPAVRP